MTSWTSHFIKQASCWILIFIIQYQDLIGRPALIYLHASKSIFFVFIPHMWKVSLCLLTSSYYSPLHFASSWSVHCPRSAYMLKYHIQAMGPTNVVSSSVGWLNFQHSCQCHSLRSSDFYCQALSSFILGVFPLLWSGLDGLVWIRFFYLTFYSTSHICCMCVCVWWCGLFHKAWATRL